LLPAVRQRTEQPMSFTSKHAEEEHCFDDIRHLLQSLQTRKENLTVELCSTLYEYTKLIYMKINQSLADESEEVTRFLRCS
jgi:hypothetical protein